MIIRGWEGNKLKLKAQFEAIFGLLAISLGFILIKLDFYRIQLRTTIAGHISSVNKPSIMIYAWKDRCCQLELQVSQ
jgi:hypothetical protein